MTIEKRYVMVLLKYRISIYKRRTERWTEKTRPVGTAYAIRFFIQKDYAILTEKKTDIVQNKKKFLINTNFANFGFQTIQNGKRAKTLLCVD